MKGIILAGGSGVRFRPCSLAVNKHLAPIFDQPVIHHPLALLMRAGIRDIVVVGGEEDVTTFQKLLGDGDWFGIRLDYVTQPRPSGIADAIACCEPQIGDQRFCVMLGDNVFLGATVDNKLQQAMRAEGAVIFACHSDASGDFGVLEMDQDGVPVRLEEKPDRPGSPWVVPGLYVYPGDAFGLIRTLHPSDRGELEVTSLNQTYLERQRLEVIRLDDVQWHDTGTPERLLEAAARVREQEARDGVKPGCPEVVGWHKGWLTGDGLASRLAMLEGSRYGAYVSGATGRPPEQG